MNEIMPVLREEEIYSIQLGFKKHRAMKEVAQVQNKADRKWMVEWIEAHLTDTYLIRVVDLQKLEEAIDE